MQNIGERIILCKQKRELAQKLLLVTELIRGLLQKDKFEQACKKLKKRTEILSRLKSLENSAIEHHIIRKISLDSITTSSEEELLQTLLSESTKIFEKILDFDQEIKTHILHKKKKVSRRIKEVFTNHNLHNRYFPRKEGDPKIFRFSI